MSNVGNQSERLDRIEDKIDRLSDAIVALARVEEKIASLEIKREEHHARIDNLARKVEHVDTQVTTLVTKVSFMQKASWVILSVIITAFASQYLNF